MRAPTLLSGWGSTLMVATRTRLVDLLVQAVRGPSELGLDQPLRRHAATARASSVPPGASGTRLVTSREKGCLSPCSVLPDPCWCPAPPVEVAELLLVVVMMLLEWTDV
jgi:hypothetical protein